jgi:hypothetical protein
MTGDTRPDSSFYFFPDRFHYDPGSYKLKNKILLAISEGNIYKVTISNVLGVLFKVIRNTIERCL